MAIISNEPGTPPTKNCKLLDTVMHRSTAEMTARAFSPAIVVELPSSGLFEVWTLGSDC